MIFIFAKMSTPSLLGSCVWILIADKIAITNIEFWFISSLRIWENKQI